MPTISRRLSKNDVGAYKGTPRDSTRLYSNLVMVISKGKDKPRPKSKPRKRRYLDNGSC